MSLIALIDPAQIKPCQVWASQFTSRLFKSSHFKSTYLKGGKMSLLALIPSDQFLSSLFVSDPVESSHIDPTKKRDTAWCWMICTYQVSSILFRSCLIPSFHIRSCLFSSVQVNQINQQEKNHMVEDDLRLSSRILPSRVRSFRVLSGQLRSGRINSINRRKTTW